MTLFSYSKSLKKQIFLFLFLLPSLFSFAADPITSFTITKNNASCLSNGSITINFPTPPSGSYEPNWTAELSISGSNAQPRTISVPTNGSPITFGSLIAGSYNITVTNGTTTLIYGSNPVSVTTSYISMAINVTSTAPTTCAGGTDAKLKIDITNNGGTPPFTYTVISPSLGTFTYTTTSRTYEFTGLKGGENVTYKVKDACNAEPTSNHTIVNNTNPDLAFAIRPYNFVKDCNQSCTQTRFYVNLSSSTAIIGNRLTTLQSAGNAQVTIKNGSINLGTYPLSYVGRLNGDGNYRFEYNPASTGGPAIENGYTLEVSLNWGCSTLTGTTKATLRNFTNVFPQTIMDPNDPCNLTNRIRILGEQDVEENNVITQRNIYFCNPTNVLIEKSTTNTNANFVFYRNSSLTFTLDRSDVSAGVTENNIEPGVYRVTVTDNCNTPNVTVLTVATQTPISRITNNSLPSGTASILQGTGGIYLGSASAGTGFAAIKYPLIVKLERTDNQTSFTLNPTQPANLAGSYNITFPKTITINNNPGQYLYFADLPLGSYKITLTDACNNSFIINSLSTNSISGPTYNPIINVTKGCVNANTINYDLNRNNFTMTHKLVELRVKNVDNSEGTLITSLTSSSSAGSITGVPSGEYYLVFKNIGENTTYSVARDLLGTFSFRIPVTVDPYENINVDISTQYCDVSIPNSGIASVQIASGNLVYPLSMAIYSQSNPSTAIQTSSITAPNTSAVFSGLAVGNYFVKTTSACYTFDKNFSINTVSTPPTAKVSEGAICPSSPTTAAAISATNNLYDIDWYISGTNTVIASGMPITLSPTSTTTYTAKFKLKSSFNCTSAPTYTSDVTVTVTPNPDLTNPQVTDINICNNTSPFVSISSSQNNFTYEILSPTNQSYSPKVTQMGNGGNITVPIPNHVNLSAGNTLKVRVSNSNAGCTGILNDLINITQSTPNLNLDVEGSAVCSNTDGTIKILSAENGITYTVLKNGQTLSPTVTGTGTGSDQTLTIPSTELNSSSNVFSIQASGSGCTAGILAETATITVLQSPTTSSLTNANCSGGKGSITLTTFGGSGQYEYKLNSGSYSSNNSFNNLAAGSYTLTSRDLTLGCTTIAQIEIKEDCFTVTKTSTTNPNTYDAVGDVLTYNIVVTNTGSSTLTNIQVSDPKATISNNTIATLSPGANSTVTATYMVTQNDLDAGSFVNTATATFGPLTISDNEIVNATLTPKITLTKTPSTYTYSAVGNVITYTFTVVNTGNITLSNVFITDPLPGLSTITPASISSLAPGATATFQATYTITQSDVNNTSLTNTATATGSYNNINYTDTKSVTISSTVVLPATGLELKVRLVNNTDAELTWNTTTEQNTHYFIIEKSTDGIHFFPIGSKIMAAGTSFTKLTYTTLDRNLTAPSTIFYRVKLYDLDKSNKYSNTVYVKVLNNGGIKIYPNPVLNIINIEFKDIGKYELSIFGYNGQLIKKIEELNINAGNKHFTLDRSNLKEGSYLIRIINLNNGKLFHERLVLLPQ